MEFGSFIIIIFKESAIFFSRLLPYLLVGLFVGSAFEVALSRYKEIHWLRQPGVCSYMIVSLIGIGTPL